MSIIFDKNKKMFNISTPNTSYVFGIIEGKHLVHLYYGKKLSELDGLEYESGLKAISTRNNAYEEVISYECICQEYPSYGNSDLRTPAFHARYEDGSRITEFEYVSHTITGGKPRLNGLPATYTEDDSEAQTLTVLLEDKYTGLKAYLSYTAFSGFDAIAKSVKFVNGGNKKIEILSALSTGFDFMGTDYDILHLSGRWAGERNVTRTPLTQGAVSIDSKRGASSHMQNPFVALLSKDATEDFGQATGFSFLYSGNFLASAEVDHLNHTRILMGINPFDFKWTLESGEEFQTPEVVCVHSDSGIGQMSRTYHKLYRTRLCRGKYRDAVRPVLVNNWEATYFDFNEDKIMQIADYGKKLGIELMVLDDGWFGKRDTDNCSLGDWYADKNKLPSGISGLSEKVNEIGMKFGLWFEPEMVSPDSDLYRAHPDWCIHCKDRIRNEGRQQLILDLSRKDVCDYIKGFLRENLSSANISYIKWDMNRNMTDMGSALLPENRQSEQAHRYILGLYDILETITKEFPDVLFEGCSGGGGRFDAGMLYYTPQIWTSDCSDAAERLKIQEGTSIVYPFSAMGCHVSAVPNHQCGRTTPYMTRFNVAMPGEFGYELDLSKLSEEELEMTKEQIKLYKNNADFLHTAEFYRLRNTADGNITAWEFVSESGDKAIMFAYMTMVKANDNASYIKLKNLKADRMYKCSDGKLYNGGVLMNFGYRVNFNSDFQSDRFAFEIQ